MSTKKKILVALSAVVSVVAIVAASVFGTVAYLTESAAVSNTFTIGDVNLSMTESKVTPDGKVVTGEGAGRVSTNTYNLVPDTTYTKDPKIFINAGSESAFLFIVVRNDIESIEAGYADDGTSDETTIAAQLAANGWAKYKPASTGWVYVYCGTAAVPDGNVELKFNAPEASSYNFSSLSINAAKVVGNNDTQTNGIKLFDSFTTQHDDSNLDIYASAKVTITAVAIQSNIQIDDGETEYDRLDKAWEAITDKYPTIYTS